MMVRNNHQRCIVGQILEEMNTLLSPPARMCSFLVSISLHFPQLFRNFPSIVEGKFNKACVINPPPHE